MLLALSLAKSRSRNPKLRGRVITALRQLPDIVSETLKLKDSIIKIAPEIASKDNALFLGRGIFYPIAKEGALKLKEISYIHAEAYPAGEMKHGVNALIGKDMPSLIMAPSGKSFNKMVSTVNEIKARDGEVIGILDVKNNEMNSLLSNYLIIDSFNYYLVTFLYSITLQLLSFYASLILKINPDRPRNLAKAVTVE